jgi:hypothetical protein
MPLVLSADRSGRPKKTIRNCGRQNAIVRAPRPTRHFFFLGAPPRVRRRPRASAGSPSPRNGICARTCHSVTLWRLFACCGAVRRMTRVDRPTVIADRRIEPVEIEASFERVVTVRAERLKLAETKRVPVSPMRDHMVGDGGQRDHATFDAEPAQRLVRELQAATPTPDVELIPFTPGTRLWSAGQSSLTRRSDFPAAPSKTLIAGKTTTRPASGDSLFLRDSCAKPKP